MNPLQIVCLEDDKTLRSVMSETLAWLEPAARVEVCATVEQLQMVVTNRDVRTDLFMIDIRVQGVDRGIEVARELREGGSQAVIALMSAYNRPKSRIMEELDLRWLPKPLDADAILALIDAAKAQTA
jgi:CheY-like chemotaxis protein